MNILITGKGGREHALARALSESSTAPTLFAHPGSDAISELATRVDAEGIPGLVDTMKQREIDLCVAGEEQMLADGLADVARDAGIPTFGPCRASARLESSKSFAKDFMRRHEIPTAGYRVVDDPADLRRAVHNHPVVLKFNGLAAGKGVSICRDAEEVEIFIDRVFEQRQFGKGEVVVEECLTGKELSVICAVADGDYQVFVPARDYKRQLDGDAGPNTGGMGAVASRRLVSESVLAGIEDQVIRPTVQGLEKDRMSYRGFLYFGLMLTADGPRVLEYNCRFGDPEAQAVLPLVEGDLAGYLRAAAGGRLEKERIHFADDWSICVVLAGRDYPAASNRGDIIEGLDEVTGARIYHAGTMKTEDGAYATHGGRILAVAARGPSRGEALSRVNHEADRIRFDGMQRRRDIGRLHFEEAGGDA